MLIRVLLVVLLIASFPMAAFAEDKQEEIERIRWSGDYYDKYRQIAYWGYATLMISDYKYGTRDAERLKLIVKGKDYQSDLTTPAIKDHFDREFRRYFGDIPFNDLDHGRDGRLNRHLKEMGNLPIGESRDRWEAAELARRRALYQGNAGALHCQVEVKRDSFPVLYKAACNISAYEDLRPSPVDEAHDLGFSSPEHIAGEIRRSLTELLRQKSEELAKIRKYGKR
jgi:hypothetical protein